MVRGVGGAAFGALPPGLLQDPVSRQLVEVGAAPAPPSVRWGERKDAVAVRLLLVLLQRPAEQARAVQLAEHRFRIGLIIVPLDQRRRLHHARELRLHLRLGLRLGLPLGTLQLRQRQRVLLGVVRRWVRVV